MLRAIIFDLNGVFIQSPKLSDRFHAQFGVSKEEFLAVLKEIMAKVRMPKSNDVFSYWQPYLEKWGIKMTEQEFFDFWFNAEKEVPEMTALARSIKEKGIKLFILSNNLKERTEYYEKNFPFLNEIFDKVYYSWQTGFVKPSPKAFENLLLENNLKPEECIYFDDSETNVGVAQNLGIKSFIFENAESVQKILEL